MQTNELFIALATGLITFIIISAYKKSQNQDINKADCFKISLLFASITFAILSVYTKPLEPILSEPFESSSTS